MKSMNLVLAAALLSALVLPACEGTGPPSRGEALVRLPAGDAARGRRTFEDLHCWACHRVAGYEFQEPVATPPTEVTLGSRWTQRLTGQELATSIIDPSHEINEAYAEDVVRSGERSRMGSFMNIEVEQLVDLVAFLREVNEKALAR